MKRTFLTSLALILGLSATLSAGSEPHQLQQLNQILKRAASHSPIVIAEDLKVAEKDASRLRSVASRMPEVTASYDIGVFHEIRESIDSDEATRAAAQYTIRAAHPLYHWGAVEALREAGFGEEKLAQITARIAFAELVSTARQEYFNLVSRKFELETMDRSLEYLKKKEATAIEAAQKGLITENELDAARIAYKAKQIQRAQFNNLLFQDFARFKFATGATKLTYDQLPSDLPELVIDIKEVKALYHSYTGNGFSDTLPSQAAKTAEDVIKHQLVQLESREKPTFNLGLGVSQRPEEANNGDYELQTIFFAGITGEWRLFDREQTSDGLRSLQVRRRLVRAELEANRDRLLTEALGYIELLDTSLQAIELRKQALEYTKSSLKTAQEQLRLGEVTEAEVDAAREARDIAHHALVKDLGNALSAYFAFLGALFLDPATEFYNPSNT